MKTQSIFRRWPLVPADIGPVQSRLINFHPGEEGEPFLRATGRLITRTYFFTRGQTVKIAGSVIIVETLGTETEETLTGGQLLTTLTPLFGELRAVRAQSQRTASFEGQICDCPTGVCFIELTVSPSQHPLHFLEIEANLPDKPPEGLDSRVNQVLDQLVVFLFGSGGRPLASLNSREIALIRYRDVMRDVQGAAGKLPWEI